MNIQPPPEPDTTQELLLWNASLMHCKAEIKHLLLKSDRPVNVNWSNPGSYLNTALHLCSSDEDPEIISLLLAHPGIEVNKKNAGGWTPLLWACKDGRVDAVATLLRDPRVDVNTTNYEGASCVWISAFRGWGDIMRWLVVLRGPQLDLNLRTNETHMAFPHTTAREISGRDEGKQFWDNDLTWQLRTKGRREVRSLLDKLVADRALAQFEAKLELGISEAMVALVYGLTVLVSDGYLEVKLPADSPGGAEARRFFRIAKVLPIELQMYLCHRLVGSRKLVVLAEDAEVAFRHSFKVFEERRKGREEEGKKRRESHCNLS